ncbi:amino acid permease [Streptomyces albus]|uniref:amino acid permease n=1 Tax=Streptomyces albus TaxID=1888 RepID=UPI000A8D9404|nr:amino acid permease [Streptomyces albus]
MANAADTRGGGVTTQSPEGRAPTPGALVREDGYASGLRNRQVQMIAVGGAIGTGLFLGAGERLHSAGPSLVIVFAVTGLFAFFIARAMGELVMHRPTSGSFVSYSRELLGGEKAAFVAGWVYFLHWICSGIAEITAVAVYLHYWSALRAIPQWTLALFALLVVLGANLISVRWFGEFEFWFALIKVAAIIAFLAVGCWLLASRHPVQNGEAGGPQMITDHGGMLPHGFLAALIIVQGVVFSYAAIEMVGITAGETENPRKVIPKAINSVSWRIVVFYVGSVLLLVLLLPWTAYSGRESPFVTLMSHIGVPGADQIMNFVVLTAALSSCNSGLYSTGRTLRSMGLAGSAPPFTTKMNRRHVPFGGILLTASFYLLGIVLNYIVPERAFSIVLNFSAITMIGTWAMIILCQLALRRRVRQGRAEDGGFHLPGAPFTSYLTLAFLLLVVVLMACDGDIGTWSVACMPLIALALWGGWYAVRKRVTAMATAREQEQAPDGAEDPAGT